MYTSFFKRERLNNFAATSAPRQTFIATKNSAKPGSFSATNYNYLCRVLGQRKMMRFRERNLKQSGPTDTRDLALLAFELFR